MQNVFKNISPAKTFFALALLVVVGVSGRLLPHAWDTTPITALALFVSVYFGVEYSIFFVLVAMFISDSIIGFYAWQVMFSVYGSFFIASFLGQYIKRHKNIGVIFVTTFGSSLIFFLVTNWAVWQFGAMYSHSFSGLIQSYVMGIPFFRNSLVGDLFYSGLFFGAFEGARALFFGGRRSLSRNFYKAENHS